MKKTLNEEIVATIRNSLPANETIVSFLSDLFFWNKEAIYRRLRCEIAFSYEDLVLIAEKLNFSIDNIIRLNRSEQVLYDLSLQKATTPLDLYCEKREHLNLLSEKVCEFEGSNSLLAVNYIPFSFLIHYPMLTKFDYYKWMHQTYKITPDVSLSQIELPQQIIDIRKRWMEQDRSKSAITYIMDRNMFSSFIRDVEYFYQRNLISTQELEEFRADLISMVDNLLLYCNEGVSDTSAKMKVYISPIDITTNHTYLEYADTRCCYIMTYGIDILLSYYPEACETHKSWIERHRRHSTLITQCNEMERFEYFKTQRKLIMALGETEP